MSDRESMSEPEAPPEAEARRPERRERIERTAEEARQGRIILGPRGRWVWGAGMVLVVLFALLFSLLGFFA